MTEDVRKLLGGYATGTLTQEERTLLYQAALEDASLFEALADEEALRDLLEDPRARAAVLNALENRPFTMTGALREWFGRPKSKALVATGAVLLVAVVISQLREKTPVEVARTSTPVTITAPAPQQEAPVQTPAAGRSAKVRKLRQP